MTQRMIEVNVFLTTLSLPHTGTDMHGKPVRSVDFADSLKWHLNLVSLHCCSFVASG